MKVIIELELDDIVDDDTLKESVYNYLQDLIEDDSLNYFVKDKA